MWKRDTEGLTHVQSSVTSNLFSYMRVTIFSFFLITLFTPLPVSPPMSFDHPYNFYEITPDKPVKKLTAPIGKMTKVGVFRLRLFLLIGYTYFINFICSSCQCIFSLLSTGASRYRRKLLPQIARFKPSTDHLAW